MKRYLLFTIIIFISFLSKSNANNFIFSGTGNWNNASNWTPTKPQISPSYNIYYNDTITIDGLCTISDADQVAISQNVVYLINGELINNSTSANNFFVGNFIINPSGKLTNNAYFNLVRKYLATNGISENSFTNYGSVINNGTLQLETVGNVVINNGNLLNYSIITSLGRIINNKQLENHGDISTISDYTYFDLDSAKLITVLINADIENNGTINNDNEIYADGYFINNKKIISNGGNINGFGRTFYNNDTIIGKLNTGGIQNNSVLSPGNGVFDTDTMHFLNYGIAGEGLILMDINNQKDNDLIIFDYGTNIPAILSNMVVSINPNFIPSITDTFVLVKVLNESPSPYKMYRNNVALPPAPYGYVWNVIQNASGISLTMDFALPILTENLLFKASIKANTVALNWSVKAIENVVTFDISRSTNGTDFENIGTLNSSSSLSYSFVDEKPFEGNNYYRLKVIDQDGKFIYSTTQIVNFSTTKNEIVNTIVENNLYLNSSIEQEIKIVNSVGEQVFISTIPINQSMISLSHLSKGIYFVKTEMSTYKIIKL